MKERDIHERIYSFVLSVLKFFSLLSKNPINEIIIGQGCRAATSVGANDQEADACESRKDFVAKYSIAKKEVKETNYWLRLAADVNNLDSAQLSELSREGKEILLIISAIVKNAKNNVKNIRNL